MSQTSIGATPPAVPSSGASSLLVDGDRNCVKCSYNIRGLPIAGKCPECGTDVAMSLKGVLLQYASPEYLATIRSGLGLVLNGILLYIVYFLLSIVIGLVVGATAGGLPRGFMLLLAVLGTAVQGMILFGYWKYTQPDPGFIGREMPDTARKIVRIAVIIQGAAAVIALPAQLGANFGGAGGLAAAIGVLIMIVGFVSFAAWIMGFFGIMRYTDWMARRIPDQFVIARVKLYIWLLPVIAVVGLVVFGLGPLIALVMYWNLLDRMRKHLKAIHVSGQPAELPRRLA